MASKQAVSTTKAPAPLPQFSLAIKYNGMVYCSGSIGVNPATKKLAEGGIKSETRQAIQNLVAVLEEAGSSLANIVKVNIFLTTMDHFKTMNEAYDEFFGAIEPKPCRTCVAVYQLPFGALVELECTAFLSPEAKL
ncbi:YjgF-like protein [Mytilinidion resinicola]|uniref:YjgF-like protein n=1 Tax=Mytilinidion resinicola TaxID=574789 RepID=A0A6A6YGH6_9PEZI|nr:YjgF-like protein [Mytilinidion resinicola]KAF2807678.1 YjgF-like protein [Mytilinidion resinicola]